MKKILLAVAVVAVSVIVAAFFSWKIAVAIILAALFLGILGAIVFISIKAWTDLYEKDPKLAKELWQQAMMNRDQFTMMF